MARCSADTCFSTGSWRPGNMMTWDRCGLPTSARWTTLSCAHCPSCVFMCACSINYWRYPCRGLRRLLDIAAVVAGDCYIFYEARRTRTLASHARHRCYFPSANSRVAGSTYQLFLLKTCSLLATAWSVTRQRPLDAQASLTRPLTLARSYMALFAAVVACYTCARKFSTVQEWQKSSLCHCR